MIRYVNIVLTTTTGHRVRYHLCLLLLVHQAGYIVNLSDFYSWTDRETDRFFAASGVLSAQSGRGFYHYLRAVVSVQLKSKVGLALAKEATLRITLNLDGAPITSRTHTHPSHSQTNVVFIFRCSSSTSNPVYVRRVDSSALVFSLSSHSHSYIGLVFSSHFID